MVGNIILIIALAVAWYFAYTRLDRKGGNKELVYGLLIFLAIAFLLVLLATFGLFHANSVSEIHPVPGR